MVVNHAGQTAMPERAACVGKGPAPAAVPGDFVLLGHG